MKNISFKNLVEEFYLAQSNHPESALVKMQEILLDGCPEYFFRSSFIEIIRSIAPQVLEPLHLTEQQLQLFRDDCDCIKYLYDCIDKVVKANANEPHPDPEPDWGNPFSEINYLLTHIVSEDFICLAQAMADDSLTNSYKLPWYAVSAIGRYRNRFAFRDSVAFCHGLYQAEAVRIIFENGYNGQDNVDWPVIDDFHDVALRNECFDEFIRQGIKRIKSNHVFSGDRLYPPTNDEYLAEIIRQIQADFADCHDDKSIRMSQWLIRYIESKMENISVPHSPDISPLVTSQPLPVSTSAYWSLIDNIWYAASDCDPQDIQNFKTVLAAYIKDKESLATIKQFLINRDKDGTINLPRKYIDGAKSRQQFFDRAMIYRALKSIGLQYSISRFYQVFPDKEA